jgi:hypothetical protein
LSAAPPLARVLLGGTGQFAVSGLAPLQTDDLLRWATELGAPAELCRAAPARRGRATPLDPGAVQLSRRLKDALDPAGLLQ